MKREARHRRRITGQLALGLVLALLSGTPIVFAGERPELRCSPCRFRVYPGQPMRLELTVRSRSTATLRWHIPSDPLLKLRAVEKLPVTRTPHGFVVYQRVIIWQALAPGATTIDGLVIERNGQKLRFPKVSITVRDPGP